MVSLYLVTPEGTNGTCLIVGNLRGVDELKIGIVDIYIVELYEIIYRGII